MRMRRTRRKRKRRQRMDKAWWRVQVIKVAGVVARILSKQGEEHGWQQAIGVCWQGSDSRALDVFARVASALASTFFSARLGKRAADKQKDMEGTSAPGHSQTGDGLHYFFYFLIAYVVFLSISEEINSVSGKRLVISSVHRHAYSVNYGLVF